ncbi:Uncharacterised protein [Mycobacterium tuberculosis]|uniref:Uncharacterized protein n=1 Tax=Mycobacterium tuberculosis TaxID=1773 RepID=A0A916L823_MYCTX|nr:Uncharacterised protein [Mycobacterium tuberculosis]
MRTSAPAWAKANAMAAPRPRPPPVMTATLSSRRNISRIMAPSFPAVGRNGNKLAAASCDCSRNLGVCLLCMHGIRTSFP